jgi:hypothetical protein
MNANYVIMQIQFGDDTIAITYADPREMSARGGVDRQLNMTVPLEFRNSVDDILEIAREMIDDFYDRLRQPPASIPSRKVRGRQSTQGDEDE